MDKDVLQEIRKLYEAIADTNKRLNDYMNQKDEKIQADIDYVAIMTDNYIEPVEEQEVPVNEE